MLKERFASIVSRYSHPMMDDEICYDTRSSNEKLLNQLGGDCRILSGDPEEAMTRTVLKHHFLEMQVLGQFNRGSVLAFFFEMICKDS